MQETQGQENPLEKGMAIPLQYSCLENSMDRGAWWARVHGLKELDMTKSLTLHCFARGDEGGIYSSQNAFTL